MINIRNLLKVALVANAFEWYEFVIYAYLADTIGQLFFNASDSISRLIQVFAVFAIGYLARPLGSLFFGIIGDRVGRSPPLKTALMIVATSTVLIGILPTYHEVGLLAPILLLTLRLMQGFAMGAELPVNACYIFEASSAKHRSILCSIVMSSATLGTLFGSFIASALFLYFDDKTILAWAWRIPFLLSLPLTVAINAIRRAIIDLPIRYPKVLDSAWHALKWPLFRGAAIMSFLTVFSLILTIWMPFYLIHFLDYPEQLARLMNMLILSTLILFFLSAGYITRLVGYQRLIKITIVMTILLICPLWWLMLRQTSFYTVFILQLLLALLFGHISGIILEALASQFPAFVRCRGMNLAYTFPIAIFGGSAPLICTWMINKTGLLMFPAFYILFFGLLALPAVWRMKGVEN